MQAYSRATVAAVMDYFRGMGVMGCSNHDEPCSILTGCISCAIISFVSTDSMVPTLTCSVSTFSSHYAYGYVYSIKEQPI